MEILYIEDEGSCPYIYTESTTIKNISTLYNHGDISEHLANGVPMAYFKNEYEPFIIFLDGTTIEYQIVYKDVEWFYDLECSPILRHP